MLRPKKLKKKICYSWVYNSFRSNYIYQIIYKTIKRIKFKFKKNIIISLSFKNSISLLL